MAPTDEITTREALEILGLKNASSISRFVRDKKLTPSRTLDVGRSGVFMFWRQDIVRLAEKRTADKSEAAA